MKTQREYNTVIELHKISKTLHRIDEGDCNGRTELGAKKSETRIKNLIKKANMLAQELGFWGVFHQTDPRGCSLYLLHTEQDKENYNTQGIAIWF
jgi:hypothetical protein